MSEQKQLFVAAVNDHIAKLAAVNNSPSEIVSNLLTNDHIRPLIMEGKKAGLSEAQIVEKLGGAPYRKFAQANNEVENSGVLANAGRGAAQAGGDMWRGVKRTGNMIVGDDADVARLDQEQAAAEADPMRMATERTGAGQTGRFAAQVAPNLLAAAATGGASIPAQMAIQAGVGAAMGAVDPHGNPLANAGTNALFSAVPVPVAAGVGRLGSKLLTNVAEKTGARATALEARALAGEEAAAARTQLQKSIADRLGLKDYDGPIDSSMVNAAETRAKGMFEAASTGRAVQVPKGFSQDIDALTELIKKPQVIKVLQKQFKNGQFVKSGDWTKLRSAVAAESSGAEGFARKALGDVVERMDDAFAAGRSPEQVQLLNSARQAWRDLQPVKDMVKKSGDSGEVTWQHFKTAVSKDTDKFARGQAPLQDLAPIAEKIQPPGKLLNKLDELKGNSNGLSKAAGGLMLDAIPFGNTIANGAKALASPPVLRGISNTATAANKVVGNKMAQQILGQLIAKGVR